MHINEKEDGIIYTKRTGAYAIIIRDEDDKIAIIKDNNNNEYYFLGGGLENNETPFEALKREALEETGYTLKNIRPYKLVNSYEYSKSRGYLNVTANVFLAEFDEKITEQIEKDYEIFWINSREYISKMHFVWSNYILSSYAK